MMMWGWIFEKLNRAGGDFGLNYAYSRSDYLILMPRTASVRFRRLPAASVPRLVGVSQWPHCGWAMMWEGILRIPTGPVGDFALN